MIGRPGELGSGAVNPDWVMLGVPIEERLWPEEWSEGWRYLVIGSTTLSRATLETVMVVMRERRPGEVRGGVQMAAETSLKAKLGGYTMAFGATYGEALGRLMEDWIPRQSDPDEPAALPAAAELEETLGQHLVRGHDMIPHLAARMEDDARQEWHRIDHLACPPHDHDHVVTS